MSEINMAQAPDFEPADAGGMPFVLSALRGSKNVLLVLNRGSADHTAARTWRSCATTPRDMKRLRPRLW